jgi:BioD-like phosphotransacetylase family protein
MTKTNMENELFAQATKAKLRFGNYSTEDLWDLGLKDLDKLAIYISTQLEGNTKTFLENPDPREAKKQSQHKLALEVLKFVIKTKQDENKARLEASAKRAQKEFLTSLLEKKQIQQLENLTEDEIKAQLAALD